MTRFQKKLWIGLFIMALLTPLGVLLPEKFKAEEAWGEWGAEKLEKVLGYVPEGLKKLGRFRGHRAQAKAGALAQQDADQASAQQNPQAVGDGLHHGAGDTFVVS